MSALKIICFLFFACVIFSHFLYDNYFQWKMPSPFTQKKFLVEGIIKNVPAKTFYGHSFLFQIKKYWFPNDTSHDEISVIKLSWRYAPKIKSGEKWQLWVKLKPPVGLHNIIGMDYKAWLLHHQIAATGYVIS